MTAHDAVSEYLARRKMPPHVIGLGLAGLIADWERVADEVADGYELGLDDYRNDLDLRQILHEVQRDVPEAWTDPLKKRLQAADRHLRTHLVAQATCIWGEKAAAEHRWTAAENWWYFHRPRRPGAELARDLARAPAGH
jgi:hypothetical protein